MAAVSLGPALWQDGPTYNGETVRQNDIASGWFAGGTVDALQVRSGVINNSVGSLQVLPVSGMTVKVGAGYAIVANTTSNLQSGYKTGTMTSVQLTVPTADATNPRIDLVVIGVNENGDSTSGGYLNLIQGTPAASPTAPAVPANALSLATIRVNANSSSVASTNITDTRVYTTAAGGVVPWPSLTGIPAGHQGLIAYDVANGRFFHNDSSGADQLAILPWKPVYATRNSNVGLGVDNGVFNSITSVNITTDGHTDIKITTHWPGLFSTNATQGGYNEYNFAVYLDSNYISGTYQSVDNSQVQSQGGQSAIQGGGTDIYTTSSATSDTPAAGTHTISWKCKVNRWNVSGSPTGNGSSAFIWASATENAYLRVEPVIL